MKIEKKIIIVTALSCLVTLLLFQLYYVLSALTMKRESVNEFRVVLMNRYDQDIKHQVENVVSMLDGLYKLHKQGKISLDEAKYQGKELVRNIRYGSEGYFWIDTYDGTNVMHAYKPEIEGKNRIDARDIKGKLLIKEIIENGRKQGGDYTDFYFTKGNGNVPYPKRGYSLSFEPFEWVIGTGNYLDQIEDTVKREEMYYSREIINSLFISAAVFFAVAFISILVSRYYARKYITRPLDDLVSAFSELSAGDGDLSRKIELSSRDELQGLADSFNSFTGKIRTVIADVIAVADELASVSAEVSSSTTSFSDNSQSQASSAEEVSASTEEVSGEVDLIASLALRQSESIISLQDKINELTAEITELGQRIIESRETTTAMEHNSDEGMKALAGLNESMKQILSSSGEMDKIVMIINDISEKINLLSLNAAIESARAGEAGRGFAVVADEISKLADQTAGSIKDINSLIKKNYEEINRSMEKLETANGKINGIIDGVRSIDEVIINLSVTTDKQARANEIVNSTASDVINMSGEIKERTGQQKTAMDEVVSIMVTITELTQSSAAGAEQMAETGRQVAVMADALKDKVGFFKV